jgi:L-alanine-DL-glutamate epimerase-like enolase superfamily enzyme
MKISGMEVSLHRLPLKEPWGDSTHRITHIELILCKLSTDTSHNGVGYSYTVGSGGAAVATLMRAYLTPIVVGEDPSYIERLWHRLWQECHDAGARGIGGLAINAIDVALWDLAGKTAGKPLFCAGQRPSWPGSRHQRAYEDLNAKVHNSAFYRRGRDVWPRER